MRLLINISNKIGGGGFQVAHSFINECKKYSENTYLVAVNSYIYSLFDIKSFPKNFEFICIKNNSFIFLANKMKKIERKFKPEVVFSVFGPVYWRPKVPHIVGFANSYYILMKNNSNNVLRKCFSKKEYFFLLLKKKLHTFFMNRDADVIIAETNYCTQEFLKIFYKVRKGYTVYNTYSNYFNNSVIPIQHNNFVLLSVCKYYRHKNLEIINDVCKELLRKGINDIRFMVTLDEISYKKLFYGNPYVYNVGYVAPCDCPELYAKSDAMFLPTLTECFSASYPEAMKCNIPILTSNLEFAHSICDDAALYFNPFNAKEIVEKIILLKNDKEIYKSFVKKGQNRVKYFSSASDRCEKYLSICNEILNDKK